MVFGRRAAWGALLLASVAGLWSLGSTVLGCGGGQTQRGPLDNDPRYDSAARVTAFLAGWRPGSTPPRVGTALGVVDTQTLIGLDLASGKRWRVERQLSSRPAIAGGLVVGLGGGKLFALQANSGELVWERRAEGSLRGASDDGDMTLVSLASLSGRHTTLLAINRAGRVVRQLDADGSLGVPALLDGVAFIPMRRKAMLLLDLVDGEDHVRIAAAEPVSHALVVGRHVYMAEEQALRIDSAVAASPSARGHWVRVPERAGMPAARWLLPSTVTLPAVASDYDVARRYVALREDATGLLHVTQVQGPLAVGLTPETAATRWVASARGLFLGGSTGTTEVVLCDSSGQLRWLDAVRGTTLAEADLGQAVLACVVDSQRPPDGASPASSAPSFYLQLERALNHPSPLALPMQLALLEDLAQLRGAVADRLLSQLSRPPAQAPPARLRLAQSARSWLRRRGQLGAARMLADP